jgi:23S rRNA pseudouridine1911/1915/1917 synthase
MGDGVRTRETDGRTTRELAAPEAGRLDAVLARAFDDLSRARVQRLIEAGHARVNGEVARKSTTVQEGDALAVEVPETSHDLTPTGLDLVVLFEDEHLAAVDKPVGLAVHGAPGDMTPTVAGWWLEQLGERASAFDAERPGIVHRLDKDTTGVLLLAKTPAVQTALSAAFEHRETSKVYLAVVDGIPTQQRAVIDAPIDRDPRDRTRMAVTTNGRESRTEYEVVGDDRRRAVLVVRPESGRTHQIRVHLAAIGFPVVDDPVYGRKAPAGRQLLHAYQIAVPHPAGGRLTVTAPAPADLAREIRSLGLETLASKYSAAVPPTLEP